MIWTLLACAQAPAEREVDLSRPDLVELEAPRLLRRLSLDLRGTLPSVEELDAVEADPEALLGLRDEMLLDPLLEDRLVHLFDEVWHTRVDEYDIAYYDYGLEALQEYAFERAAGEEPLRLMAHVAVQDQPWSTVLTADYTLADELLEEIWPLDREPGEGWQKAVWTDGRPAAGLLSSNGLWFRYPTNSFNRSRTRAAAITRLLACDDILDRPVSFDQVASLVDQEESTEAVLGEATCRSCHATLEPIAATLFGFYPTEQFNVLERTWYHPERERYGEQLLGVESAWYGEPVSDLEELAWAISVDPRFVDCTVETVATGLWRRPVDSRDHALLDALASGRDGEMSLLTLLAELTDTPEYRAGELSEQADQDSERERTHRLLGPAQLSSLLAELTGLEWEHMGYRQLDNDEEGYRVLGGGVNGVDLQSPQQDPGLTWALVAERAVQAGAATLVQQRPSGASGLELLPLDEPDPDLESAIEALHWRILARRPSADEVDELLELHEGVVALEGDEAAWEAVLVALLRDPEALSY